MLWRPATATYRRRPSSARPKGSCPLGTSDTRLRWNLELIVLKWNYSHRCGVCRPRVMHIIADFLVRTATEKGTNTARTNSPWRQC